MPFKKNPEITVYTSKNNSKMSELTKAYFVNNGLNFEEVIIDHDESARIKMEEISDQKNTPVTVINDRVIVGFQPNLYDIILFGAEAND